MPLRLRILLALLPLLPALRGAESWTGDPAKGAAELEHPWQEVEHPKPSTGIRGVFRFALEASGLNWHPERVQAALALARRMQDTDPASPTYGNFHWRYDHPRVYDQNAVEFAMQLAGLLHLKYHAALTPEALHGLDEIMTTAIEGMHRHHVAPEYTNIYLMKAWDLIAVGESLAKPDVANEGYEQLKTWIRATVANGIAEYGGVTYYGVDLDTLGLLARYAPQPEARDIAGKALAYLWTDIASNWWGPGDRLACANSRSYDYLFGRGYLEAHTWTAGWLRQKPVLEGAGWLSGKRDDLVTFRRDVTWIPPVELTDRVRTHVPRTVVQRWAGAPLEQRATLYLSNHVTLATSGNSHGPDDRTLVADLGDSPKIPQLIMFMDGRGDPYGTKKTENAANEAKALHLTPFICAVQRGPEAVQLLSKDFTEPKSRRGVSVFYTQITIPAAAQLYSGKEPVTAGTPEAPVRLAPDRPVFVVLGDAALGLRFLVAEGCDGKPAPIEYISDGPKLPARRLTIVHSPGVPTGIGTVAVWFRAADGLDAKQLDQFRQDFTKAKATVRVSGAHYRLDANAAETKLRIDADVAKRSRMELAGQEPDGLFSVNGYDVGHELLEEFGAR